MNVRCTYCRQSFNLNQEYIVQLVHTADEAKQKNAVLDCINCRKKIKISVQQMRRYMPVVTDESEEE
jgi:5-methylcytosine-specific restriction endonuclease McrA